MVFVFFTRARLFLRDIRAVQLQPSLSVNFSETNKSRRHVLDELVLKA